MGVRKMEMSRGTREDTHGAEAITEMASGKDGGDRVILLRIMTPSAPNHPAISEE
jgi:hypothetical protein